MYWIRRKLHQIKKVLRFLPVIWKTYDFDYRYALDLFTMQLEDTAKFLESDKARTVSAEYNAQKIRTTLRLMKKVYDQEYSMEYHQKFKKVSGGYKLEFIPYKDDPELFELVKVYEKDYTDKEKEELDKIQSFYMDKARRKEEKAHRILWKMIEYNIRNWWD